MEAPRAGRPMKRLCIDIVNMHRITERGNKVVLVVTDSFTKWTEAYALPDHKAGTVAKTLVVEYILRYGVPLTIHSDQGPEFESKLFACICKLLGIDKTRTTPYNPSSNGEVERLNRSILTMLKAFTDQKLCADWDEYLPFVLSAYRNSRQESTKMTPNRMMLNREVDMPLDLIYGGPAGEDVLPFEYAEAVRKAMRDAHALARECLGVAAVHQKRNYDEGTRKCLFQPGDWVWFLYTPRAHNKLLRVWTGPFLVLDKRSNVTFRIQEKETSLPRVVHGKYLKKFEGSDAPQDWRPIQIQEAAVSEIETEIGEAGVVEDTLRNVVNIPSDGHVSALAPVEIAGDLTRTPVQTLSHVARRALLDRTRRTDRLLLNSPLVLGNESHETLANSQHIQAPEEDKIDEWTRLSQENPDLGQLNPHEVGEGKPTSNVDLGLTGLRRTLRESKPPTRFGML